MAELGGPAHLVLAFAGAGEALTPALLSQARGLYPGAPLHGCTTAGEILGTEVSDDALALTAVRFEGTLVRTACARVSGPGDSHAAGERLGRELAGAGLVHVLVLSNWMGVSGSALVKGLSSSLPPGTTVTGGLAGDGGRFKESFVICDGVPERDTVVAIGLYGARLKVGCGSLGGWDPFGPERLVTRSEGSTLYELDGKSALDLYKSYLGDHARGLPGSGLLFPLTMRGGAGGSGVVRTILGVNEERKSMTFAGDIPVGSIVRLMKANIDPLIDGAVGAARASCGTLGTSRSELALLISCVGRKMVLQQRVEEEVEGVSEVLGAATALTGFYSYGEICPFKTDTVCELHNQTMTITTLAEG